MAETDAKAGYCSNCRRGEHTLCASPTCTCPDMRKHRNRPGFAGQQRSAPVTPIVRNEPKGPQVVWEEPPGRAARISGPIIDAELERELRANCGRWAKVRTYAKPTSAGSAGTRVRKGLTSLKPDEWESTARRVGGGSALYLRFVGGQHD